MPGQQHQEHSRPAAVLVAAGKWDDGIFKQHPTATTSISSAQLTRSGTAGNSGLAASRIAYSKRVRIS